MNLPTVPYLTLPFDQVGQNPTRHALPANVQLGPVVLQIADLDASLDFYTNVIGLHLHGREEGQARAARLGTPEGEVLIELREKKGVKYAPHRGRLGLYHVAVLLPTRADLGRFIRHALGLGVHVGQSDHHYSEATYLKDPDGLTVEVYRDRPRDEWRVTQDGEIIGGGDLLDLGALDEAAGDAPWRGVPTGTTLGHLHFYVGDLDEAARFYHAGLGFPKVSWSAFPSALFLGAGGYHHHLGLNTWAAGSAPSGDDDARLLTWDLVLPDEATVERTARSLRAEGFSVTVTPSGLLADDPWGITVRLRTA
ncbi:VOC family protein [Deinococcus yavapaiensis]|uniref:Catechol 2,3-dioxygenase n=1 Tax=Deinococcus yavapaiensis KR-236 TaxID=694435 RepID=A0A318S0X7_9DEIO|nr:VOC family protein [Deinococcus yavapaiensis]PYE50546.1 catechol 2,3-dioxygenase [Deinococcus yavapaiensis KR-236]